MSSDADTIRAMIEHENLLTNHRMEWSLKIQGLLFAALAVGGEKSRMLDLVCLLGIGISILTTVDIWLSTSAVMRLLKWWKDEKQRLADANTPYSGPPVIGVSFEELTDVSYVSPSLLISVLFMGAWMLLKFG